MSLYGMMVTSASGMAAQASQLSTVADNIANADTVGYKRASEQFSTLVLESGTAEYNSGAVAALDRRLNDIQGTFNYTSSKTDLAIQGTGFFLVSGPDGSISLTRAGSFTQNSAGELVNSAGYKLMAYPSSAGAGPAVNGYAGLQAVNVAGLGPMTNPSTSGTLSVNLPVDSAIVNSTDLPSQNSASAQYSKMTSLVAYDNVGTAKTLDIYETKSANNTWEIAVFDHATAATGGGFPYASGPLQTTTLQFDPTTGKLASSSAQNISLTIPNGKTLTIDLSSCTELAGAYSVNAATLNGSAPSSVDHVEVDASGKVNAVFQNGTSSTIYQLAIGSVASPDNLELKSGNIYLPTSSSGSVVVGLPQVGNLGKIVPSALEKSNVDVATELTTMIASQHSYTANSKVFQTAADLMDVLINLKR
ncbi:MAG: flagellar hook protein FlgE [Proteobacteria bacterium]|nr:flagellar hook protein FlgE [Pseudomonadota bacterium]